MELSAELLQSTLNHLKGDPVEQRKHPRAPLRARLKIVPYENGALGHPYEVWTLDISAGGLGIMTSKPLRADRKFIVRLTQMDNVPLYLLCTVRNCTEIHKDTYRIGASFAEVAGRVPPFVETTEHRDQKPGVQLSGEIRRISDAVLS
jgi:hypothetical protein